MPHRFARARPVVVAALLVAGCYRYVPAPAPPPAPGDEVRLYLTPAGTAGVAATLGPETTVVAGRTEAGTADAVRVLVASTTKAYGAVTPWVGERVTIPIAAIARSEHRVLDRRRSLLAGGAVAVAGAAAYAILRAVRGGGSGAGSDQPVPTP